MRAFSQAVNSAAGDPIRLGELAVSPVLAALPEAIDRQRAKRPLIFTQSYLLGSLDAAGGDRMRDSPSDFPACLPTASAASVEAAEGPPDAELVERALAEMNTALDREPLVAVASLGRLLGAMWWPSLSWPAEQVAPSLGGLLRGIHAFDERKMVGDGPTVIMTGSGKRRREMPSITTGGAIVAAFVLGHGEQEVTLVKPVSGGTSFRRGSSDAIADFAGRDAFEVLVGPVRLRVLRCETVLPRFARLYHGLAFATTTASLCGPAVAAANVAPTAIAYGLTEGALDACALTLADAHPGARVIAVSGRDAAGTPLADEPSAVGPTDWACADGNGVQHGRWRDANFLETVSHVSPLIEVLTGNCPPVWSEMLAKQAALVIALARGDGAVPSSAPDQREVREAIASTDFGEFVALLSRGLLERSARLSWVKSNSGDAGGDMRGEEARGEDRGDQGKDEVMSVAVTQGESGAEEKPERVSAVVSQGEDVEESEAPGTPEDEESERPDA